MNSFKFYSPTYFSFGKDAEKNIGALVKRFGGAKVLIHYGGGRIELLYQPYIDGLKEIVEINAEYTVPFVR